MSTKNPSAFSALFSGLASALQWRVLLWWALALGLPTLLLALPLWSGLNAQFGHSLQAADIAFGRNTNLLIDGFIALNAKNGGNFGAPFAVALSLLLSPWLTGMVVASLRAGRPLKMGELAHGGLAEYWRMFRLLLWSIIPIGIAVAIGAGADGVVKKVTEHAILESEVSHAHHLALLVFTLAFIFLHSTMEAARGWFGADANLHSAFRAWWRGLKLVLKRPLASAIVWIGATVVAYAFAALFAWLRVRVDGPGYGSFVLGWLLTQSLVFAIAWSRVARLYGFAALARGK